MPISLTREQGQAENARNDLDKAETIIKSGGMRLLEAELNIEYGWNELVLEHIDKARERAGAAKTVILACAYARRVSDLARLEDAINVRLKAGSTSGH